MKRGGRGYSFRWRVFVTGRLAMVFRFFVRPRGWCRCCSSFDRVELQHLSFCRLPLHTCQSEERIPVSFRQIFHHVRAEIEAKYPIRSEDLAAVMIDEMATHLDGTQDAFESMCGDFFFFFS